MPVRPCFTRIAKGRFTLPGDSTTYELDQNNGPNSLHGGIGGFSFKNWDVELTTETPSGGEKQGTILRLSVVSDHMDQGFPGRIRVQCTYRLFQSTLEIAYEAELVDQDGSAPQQTIVSLTNHAYFNLNGTSSPESVNKSAALVTDHEVEMLNIDHYLETDLTSVPTGNVLPLDQVHVMNFNKPKKIGQHLAQTPGNCRGYDHFYPAKAAIDTPEKYRLSNDVHRTTPVTLVNVYSPESGICMAMATTEPGFQLYTANWVQLEPNLVDAKDGSSSDTRNQFPLVGKARWGYNPHSGFCLEASRFPDAINNPTWREQVLLRRGDKYHSRTLFTFSTQ